MVAQALTLGKIGYADSAICPICLSEEDPTNATMRKLQTIINNIARVVLGLRRSERIRIDNLLQKSGLPSLNRLAVKAVAMEVWKATSGYNESNNPLGNLIRRVPTSTALVRTRSMATYCLPPPPPWPARSLACEAVKVWNRSERLRQANFISRAKKEASTLVKICPI